MTPGYQRNWRKTSPKYSALREKSKINRRKAVIANPSLQKRTTEQSRKYKFKYAFGITVETYTAMLAEQGGHCAICDAKPQPGKRWFPVDHCHETGTIRGILCVTHNLALGYLNDNEAGLQVAIDYVRGIKCPPEKLLRRKLPPR